MHTRAHIHNIHKYMHTHAHIHITPKQNCQKWLSIDIIVELGTEAVISDFARPLHQNSKVCP